MASLGEVAAKVRSKNAGPFWLTIDIFCDTDAAYQTITCDLSNERVATTLGVSPDALKRFDIADLNVIKVSVPRPAIQGSLDDRDLHGASWAALLAEMTL